MFYQLKCIVAMGSIVIVALILYQIEIEFYCLLPIGITAIEDFKTFDDSRLTAKFSVSGMRRSVQALRCPQSLRAGAFVQCEGNKKRSAAVVLSATRPPKPPCWVI